jgi:hypothetical protein
MTMPDPEQVMRDALAHLAEEVDTGAPLARRARAGRRRRARRLAGGTAAAAVLVVAVGAGVVTHRSGPEAPPSGDRSTGRVSEGAPASPGGYRLEIWHDVGVYVPASWGWGGAPDGCGVGPTVGSDGHRLTAHERTDGVLPGYVGRPVGQSGRCSTSASSQTGGAPVPYLWLGADLPVGRVDLGGGWVEETRKVAGTTVTVGSDEAGLRGAILASAKRLTLAECPASLSAPPSPSSRGSGPFSPVSLTVCAYAATGTAGGSQRYDLLYGEHLPAGQAKGLADAVTRAAPMGEHSCFAASGGEWALLHLEANSGQSQDLVVDLSCPSIADATGLQHQLTPADVLPWAVDGVNAVLHANPLIDVPGRLIGP